MSSEGSATLALARSLGAVRSRRIRNRGQDRAREETVKTKQVFPYLIVLDFETTCWADKAHAPPSEIIEFPAVLLDTASGSILDEFHTYVMPIEHPRLSEFCRELTGIGQDQVDAGVPLPTCLHLFSRWIAKITDKYKLVMNDIKPGLKSATFVTWLVKLLFSHF